MSIGCKKNFEVDDIINNLEDSYKLIVITDKNNSFRSLYTKEYMTMVNENLENSSNEIDRGKARYIFDKSRELVDEVGFQ